MVIRLGPFKLHLSSNYFTYMFTFPIRLPSDLPLCHTSDNETVEIFQEDIYVEVYYAFGYFYALLH